MSSFSRMLKNKFYILIIILLILANFFVWKEVLSDNYLEVVFLDVGQGDAIFIETPYGHQILIDGGPSGKTILEKLGKYIPFWDKDIDLVILTHPDYDHLAGLNYVLDRYDVDNILCTEAEKDTRTYEKWIKNIEYENVIIAQKGSMIRAGNIVLDILFADSSYRSVNDTSIVSKLVYGETSFLFPGDITKKIEKQLININADVLKVPHHGSKSSSSFGFLEKVNPYLAVISVGNNSYGHPHPEVLQRLEEFGITILRTDEKGDISIKSNGTEIFSSHLLKK